MTKIAVAMSGGIDSSVTALLLKKQGFDVVGLCAQTTCDENSIQVVKNAQAVAEKLNIPFYSLNVSDIFHKQVIEYFENSYKIGETPNPCIMCNKYVKWGVLFDYARKELCADLIATGHYANLAKDNGIYKLFPAADEHKDQLYFLFLLTQYHLSHTMFPLSQYKKEEVRKIAFDNDLPSKSSKESQDICFITGKTTTKKYINEICGFQEGNFIDINTGKILGKHNGCWQYTVGQRKGIGIAAVKPLYVIKIDVQTNTVYVGYKDALMKSELELKNINWSYPQNRTSFDASVKIRYNMKAVQSHIDILPNKVHIKFTEPVSAIAKGQACVIYDNNDGHLIGGGII